MNIDEKIKQMIFENSKLVDGKLAVNDCKKCLIKDQCMRRDRRFSKCDDCTKRCSFIEVNERERPFLCEQIYESGRCYFELKTDKNYEEIAKELINNEQ